MPSSIYVLLGVLQWMFVGIVIVVAMAALFITQLLSFGWLLDKYDEFKKKKDQSNT